MTLPTQTSGDNFSRLHPFCIFFFEGHSIRMDIQFGLNNLYIQYIQTDEYFIQSSHLDFLWLEIWTIHHYIRQLITKNCFRFFGWFLYVPVNNFSVILGGVFLGWTSTKQRIKCLAQGHNTVTSLAMGLPLLILSSPGSASSSHVESLDKPAIQQAFSKPCLVNLISKVTHTVFSIYSMGERFEYRILRLTFQRRQPQNPEVSRF